MERKIDCHWKYLPNDITKLIFSFLKAKDLGRISRVCTIFREISNSDDLWKPLFYSKLSRRLERERIFDETITCWKQKYFEFNFHYKMVRTELSKRLHILGLIHNLTFEKTLFVLYYTFVILLFWSYFTYIPAILVLLPAIVCIFGLFMLWRSTYFSCKFNYPASHPYLLSSALLFHFLWRQQDFFPYLVVTVFLEHILLYIKIQVLEIPWIFVLFPMILYWVVVPALPIFKYRIKPHEWIFMWISVIIWSYYIFFMWINGQFELWGIFGKSKPNNGLGRRSYWN